LENNDAASNYESCDEEPYSEGIGPCVSHRKNVLKTDILNQGRRTYLLSRATLSVTAEQSGRTTF